MVPQRSLVRTSPFTVVTAMLALASLGVAAAQPASLTGVTWQWTSYRDLRQRVEVLTPVQTITFQEDGSFAGQADCNRFLGGFTLNGSELTLTPGPSTLVACEEGSLGDAFVNRLFHVERFTVTEDGALELTLASGGVMGFVAQPLVSGSVTYLQRIALPSGSVVRVQVQDVTVADAPTIIVGEDVVVIDDQQVPIDFSVSYPQDAVQDWRRYGLSARITDPDGRLLFVTDAYTAVITNGAPTSGIELILVPVQR